MDDVKPEITCEWNKRRSCDSLYIEKYNKLESRVQKAIKYIEEEFIVDNLDDTEDFEMDILIILQILKGE